MRSKVYHLLYKNLHKRLYLDEYPVNDKTLYWLSFNCEYLFIIGFIPYRKYCIRKTRQCING